MFLSNYQTLWPYLYRYRLRIAAGLASLLLVDFLQLIIPRVVKHAVDELSNQGATAWSLAVAGLAIIGMSLIIGLLRYIWRILLLGFSRRVEEDLRSRIYSRLMTLTPAWFQGRTTGDIMALATNDIEAVRMAAGFGLVALVDSLLMGAAAVGFMMMIDVRLTLIALIPVMFIPLLTRWLAGIMHQRYFEVQTIFGRLTAEIREFLSGIRVLQAQAREDLALDAIDRVGREYVAMNVRLNLASGTLSPLMLFLSNISLALLIYFGGRMTIFQKISPGDFVAFLSYLGLITWPMMALGWVTNLVQRGAASLGRLNLVLNYTPEIVDPPAPIPLPEANGRIEIKNLTFKYPDRDKPIFRDLSLSFPASRITAIAGRTGVGKSTLLNLIPRLLAAPPGTVFFDGLAVEEVSLNDLRRAIGYVPQDGYIFSGTIFDNIAFGRPGVGLSEVTAAAKAAQLDEDLEQFPNGYYTLVGERGVTLSGGQKQRLALARALLLDPPLLIMDDTLSAVDAATEEKIVAALAGMRAGRTTIISSHRLASLRLADRIHVLEAGQLSQSGTHEELIKLDGYYARLYYLQQVQADQTDQAIESRG